MESDVFNCSRWCLWKIERVLDLIAIAERELGEDDKCADDTMIVLSVVVATMFEISSWIDFGNMDLWTFSACQPVLDTFVDLFMDFGRGFFTFR